MSLSLKITIKDTVTSEEALRLLEKQLPRMRWCFERGRYWGDILDQKGDAVGEFEMSDPEAY